jgi:predicted phage terminase large subunit-like protein
VDEISAALEDEDVAKKQEQILNLKRAIAVKRAREDFHAFLRWMMPDEEFPDDPDLSEYKDTAHGAALRGVIEKIDKRELPRSATSIPPQHGKTLHLSLMGPAWLRGRHPKWPIIAGTYNETRAAELGEAYRSIVTAARFTAVFPEHELETGSKSKSFMKTTKGGKTYFVGAGGTITGRGAGSGVFLIDDPIKDDEEIQSDDIREKKWKWFFSVAYSRGNKKTSIAVVHTRWHVDDLIGRLCDPEHPERDGRFKGLAEDWLYLNISGVIDDPRLAEALGLTLTAPTDPRVIQAFGTKPMCALWEDEKPLEFYAPWAIAEPRTFSALVRGKPAVEDGEYFHKNDLIEYDARDLPKDLRFYGASDHAVSEKTFRDFNVIGCIGVDQDDDLWVLPDIVWERMAADRIVEELLIQFKRHKPMMWWLENELISKSFGPFLHKRMVEERTYTTLDPIPPGGVDLQLRARSIQGRMRMQKVHFPRFAPWWHKARSQLLQFPYGPHDDFVSFMALIGLGLMKEMRPSHGKAKPSLQLVGSPQWVMQQSKLRAQQDQRKRANAGW